MSCELLVASIGEHISFLPASLSDSSSLLRAHPFRILIRMMYCPRVCAGAPRLCCILLSKALFPYTYVPRPLPVSASQHEGPFLQRPGQTGDPRCCWPRRQHRIIERSRGPRQLAHPTPTLIRPNRRLAYISTSEASIRILTHDSPTASMILCR